MADQTANAGAEPASTRGRSPAYPGIDLKRALELVTVVYRKDHQHAVAAQTIAKHWKLAAKSSQFLTSISAVKKFGLFDAMPQRGPHTGHVKVSNLALDIIVDEREGSEERVAAIKRAALLPDIHAALWQLYNGELPSDATLKYHLIRERKFTEAGAVDFINQFKRTIAFAGLAPSDELSQPIHDRVEAQQEPPRFMTDLTDQLPGLAFPTRPKTSQMREVPIPIQGAAWPALKAAFPMSEEAWDQMIAVLNAMKPGLVERKE
jgi:hypothetical protein